MAEKYIDNWGVAMAPITTVDGRNPAPPNMHETL